MKLEKLGDNQVKVTQTKILKDTKGKEVEIEDTDSAVEYGLSKVEAELEQQQQLKSAYQHKDFVKNAVAQCDARIAELNEIKSLIEEQ